MDKKFLFQQINYISQLQENWDNDNAKPVSKKTIQHLIPIIENLIEHLSNNNLKPKFNIYPTVEGGILFEIQDINKVELEYSPTNNWFIIYSIPESKKFEEVTSKALDYKKITLWLSNKIKLSEI